MYGQNSQRPTCVQIRRVLSIEVTLTTVGYGDLRAHKPTTKLFACLYILVGVAMIGALLAKVVEILLRQEASTQSCTWLDVAAAALRALPMFSFALFNKVTP